MRNVNERKYTRGKAGPISRMRLEIGAAAMFDPETPTVRIKGHGTAEMAKGRVRAVEFTVQGGKATALAPHVARGVVLDVDVRWVAGDKVTIVKVHEALKRAA